MTQSLHYLIWTLLVSLSSCTDLAAVYKHDILLLRDADLILPNSPLSWESLSLALPRPLSYPVGLAQDAENKRLFVAEGKPKEDGKILSLTFNSQFEVVDMTPAVKSGLMSVIEGMSYNPKSRYLYWTDATAQYIYKASVPSESGGIVSKPEVIHDLGYRNEPRGIAFDICNELLFWSEKGAGIVPSSVEMWNPDDKKHHVFQEDEGKKNIYQGLSFDATTGNLLWAVTKGDDLNSTCRIVSTLLDEMHHEELVNLENCYPFSLTSDEKYIYWADWGRQGIMRASLTDSSDVVKLVHTPHTLSKEEEHFGVYGLAKLNTESVEISCKGRKGKMQIFEDKKLQNRTQSLYLGKTEERERGAGKVEEVQHVPLGNVESTRLKEMNDGQDKEAKSTNHRPVEHIKTKGNVEKATEQEDRVVNPAPSGHLGTKEQGMAKDNMVPHEDRLVKSLRMMMLKSQVDSPSREPEQKAKSESVEAVTGLYNDKTQTNIFASQSTYDVQTTERFFRCNEGQNLVMAVLFLAVISALFFISTIILAFMLYHKRTVPNKGASLPAGEAPQAVPVLPPRQVKRFGPKKFLAFGNKSGLSGSATCSNLDNDGVSINIEDCCQMTLCETPCYTTVKKEGKSYKDIRKNTCEDKKGLLDDGDEI